MPLVTLSPGGGTGLPEGSPEHRYELELMLDLQGHPDPEAWQADPKPWPARRLWPGEGLMEGEILYDPDTGWALRFFQRGERAGDAPLHSVIRGGGGPCRPGETVSITEPDGTDYAWRIVGVG